MHMKSCGNVYVCKCGIRLCSLGALKRHCKYFNHEPESLEPRPDPSMPALDWNGMDGTGQPTGLGGAMDSLNGSRAVRGELMHLQPGQHLGGMGSGQMSLLPACSNGMPSSSSMHSELLARLGGKDAHSSMQSYLAISALMRPMVGSGNGGDAVNAPKANSTMGFPPLSHAAAQGFADHLPVSAAPAYSGYGGCGDAVHDSTARRDQAWTPEMLQGMMPSLAQALCQAQVDRVANMERQAALLNWQQQRQATLQMPPADVAATAANDTNAGSFFACNPDVRAAAERALVAALEQRGDIKSNHAPSSAQHQHPAMRSAMDALVRSQGQVACGHGDAPASACNAMLRDGGCAAAAELSALASSPRKRMLRDNESTEPPC